MKVRFSRFALVLPFIAFLILGCESAEEKELKRLQAKQLQMQLQEKIDQANLAKQRAEQERIAQQERQRREEEDRKFCCCEAKKYITKFELNWGAWMDNFIYDGSEYRWGNRESCGGTVNTGTTFNPAKTVNSCTSRSECGR